MIILERTSVMSLENAIRGAKNPMDSWGRMDGPFDENDNFVLGPNNLDLAKHLHKVGNDHRGYLHQVFVSMNITAPFHRWKEYDAYKVAAVTNSTSTMYKIHSKPFGLADLSADHMTEGTLTFMGTVTAKLEEIRLKYVTDKNKKSWYDLIQLLPPSYNRMHTCAFNYGTLVNICYARRNHRLTEWHTFCDWIETLPYARELIIAEAKEVE